MFDIGWQELFIVAIIGILVIGPKDLPRAIRTVTQYLRKARSLARDFQNGLDDVVREAELDDLKKQMDQATSYDLESEIENTIDPTGEITREVKEMGSDLDQATRPGDGFEDAAAEPESEEDSTPTDPPLIESAGDPDDAPKAASKANG